MNHDEVSRLMGPYLDGELDLKTCLELEEHLAGCEACRQKMEADQELIQAVGSETPRFEASPFLKTRIRAILRDQSPAPAFQSGKIISLKGLFAVLAIAAILFLAIRVPWPGRIPTFVQEAVADHVRSLQVNHLMDVASTDQHTVKPWFAGKLDYSPPVVDLAAAGYPLIGGRLDVLENRNVGALVYQRHKHYINLFVWPIDTGALPEHFYTRDGYHLLTWTKSGMNYLAISELNEAEFRDFVKQIQDHTGAAPPVQ